MRTQVQKWGNSLAVRIPKPLAADLGIDQDSSVDLALEDGCLVIKPTTVPRFELDQLLKGVTDENLHREYDFGPAVGNEEW